MLQQFHAKPQILFDESINSFQLFWEIDNIKELYTVGQGFFNIMYTQILGSFDQIPPY